MDKRTEKSAFSQRLKQELSKRGWPKTSPTWLAREFNMRYSGQSVSVQTANNWLSGAAIPNQDKLQILAAWLEVSTHWLRFGENTEPLKLLKPLQPHETTSYDLSDLPDKISQLTPQQKQIVYDVIEAILGNKR